MINLFVNILFFLTTGLVFHYVALVYAMFWIFHVAVLFGKIVFPFHARRFQTRGYFRYIHIAMVIAAIVLPLESVGVILGTGGLTIPRFPPVACFARETDASYFAFVLPISIVGAIGVPLIVIILWTLITKLRKLKTEYEVSEIACTQLDNCCQLKILIFSAIIHVIFSMHLFAPRF